VAGRDIVEREADLWSEEAGTTGWFLYDLASERVVDAPEEIIDLIRSTPEMARKHDIADATLSEIRGRVENRSRMGISRRSRRQWGYDPALRAWLELS